MFLDTVAALDRAALDGVYELVCAAAGGHIRGVDWAVRLLIEVSALKLGVPTLLAVYAWVRPDTGLRADPVRALRGAAGVVLTLALARATQNFLPARPRPRVAMPEFPFPPLGHLTDLADWSSMPSDTAALAFALVAVAWASSRRLGAAALAWAVSMTCLPRLYIGYHHLSDLLAGAALGVLSVAAALRAPLPAGAAVRADALLRRLDARAPGLLVLAFFALGAECLHAFEATRRMARAAGEVAHAMAAERPGGVASLPATAEPDGAAPPPSATGPDGENEDEATCGAPAAPSPCAALASD